MHPIASNYRVVYSSIVHSFGVAKTSPLEDAGELSITDLPFEILQNIASYLDSFR